MFYLVKRFAEIFLRSLIQVSLYASEMKFTVAQSRTAAGFRHVVNRHYVIYVFYFLFVLWRLYIESIFVIIINIFNLTLLLLENREALSSADRWIKHHQLTFKSFCLWISFYYKHDIKMFLVLLYFLMFLSDWGEFFWSKNPDFVKRHFLKYFLNIWSERLIIYQIWTFLVTDMLKTLLSD